MVEYKYLFLDAINLWLSAKLQIVIKKVSTYDCCQFQEGTGVNLYPARTRTKTVQTELQHHLLDSHSRARDVIISSTGPRDKQQ